MHVAFDRVRKFATEKINDAASRRQLFRRGAWGRGEKRGGEGIPRLAQAFSIRVDQVFDFGFIVAGAMCHVPCPSSLLRRHHERYSWELAVKIAAFERSCVELH